MLVVDGEGAVSWGAHVGGIVAGAILVVLLRRRGVPLFDRTIVTPKAVRHIEVAPAPVEAAAARPPVPPTHWGR